VLALVVILDTNILIVPAQFGVDVFSEAERVLERNLDFVVLRSVIDELQRKLADASRTEGHMFKIALDLTKRCRVIELKEHDQNGSVDDMILKYALTSNGVIATNDKELKGRALSQRTPVLFLRGKKQLQLTGYIV
jgi:rRNA-processing protein FCF1